MTALDVPHLRLNHQQIAHPTLRTPAEVLAHLGAVQAQDYAGGKWAVGLRLQNATEADVEQAIADRTIVRTWPMRSTLHFVPAADVRWMLELTASRADAGFASRYRQLELDGDTFKCSAKVLVKALSGGKSLTRPALYRVLEEAGIVTSGGMARPGAPPESAQARGLHILSHHAMTGLTCYGRNEGKQPAFVLLDEWVPESRVLSREEALVELAARYFTSHGPATIADFTWWSGLTVREAKAGIEGAKGRLVEEDGNWLAPVERTRGSKSVTSRAERAYLLPPWDEYAVAYRDRSAIIDPAFPKIVSNSGTFAPFVVIDGQVAGKWKRTMGKGGVVVAVTLFGDWTPIEMRAVEEAAERYAGYLGVPLTGVSVEG